MGVKVKICTYVSSKTRMNSDPLTHIHTYVCTFTSGGHFVRDVEIRQCREEIPATYVGKTFYIRTVDTRSSTYVYVLYRV